MVPVRPWDLLKFAHLLIVPIDNSEEHDKQGQVGKKQQNYRASKEFGVEHDRLKPAGHRYKQRPLMETKNSIFQSSHVCGGGD